MEKILLGCQGVVNFIDDILIYGKDADEHDKRVEHTLRVLQENNVLLNHTKGVFKITFLGHSLSPGGIRPLDKYVQVV